MYDNEEEIRRKRRRLFIIIGVIAFLILLLIIILIARASSSKPKNDNEELACGLIVTKGKHNAQNIYTSEVVVVTHLAPRKMMGEVSHGMILCAEDSEGRLSLICPQREEFEDGSEV